MIITKTSTDDTNLSHYFGINTGDNNTYSIDKIVIYSDTELHVCIGASIHTEKESIEISTGSYSASATAYAYEFEYTFTNFTYNISSSTVPDEDVLTYAHTALGFWKLKQNIPDGETIKVDVHLTAI